MTMAQIIYTEPGRIGSAVMGTLFQGRKFWISQRVPSRKRFIEEVESNGGKTVELERDADIKIVDHARKEIIPGSYSWTYIDHSVRKGFLENLDDHRVGPPSGTVRSIGSANQASKGSRTPFTADDDRILYEWVQQCEQNGSKASGNSIYKELEQMNPRHTFQSWRDRYVRYLKDKPAPVQVPTNAPPTPPLDPMLQRKIHSEDQHQKSSPDVFDNEEEQALLLCASDIENIHPDNIDEAWESWNNVYPQHSAQDWREFWGNIVRPMYLKHARIQSRSTKRKLEEMLDVQIHDETNIQRNPSYQPKPSKLVSRRLPSNDELISLDHVKSRTDLNVSPAPTYNENLPLISSIEGSPPRVASSRPERALYEPEIPSSSPLQPVTTKSNRRSHMDRQSSENPEIVSSDTDSINKLEALPRPTGNGLDIQHGNGSVRYRNRTTEQQGSPSLSEPDRHQTYIVAKSGELLKDTGPHLPSPEHGWILEEEGDEQLEDYKKDSMQRPGVVEDTQDLLNAKTQNLDFSVADPEGGWDAVLLPSSPSPLPTKLYKTSERGAILEGEENLTDDEEINAIFKDWIIDQVTAGVPGEDIEKALKSSSNNPDLTKIVLKSLVKNGSIPSNVRGVWTEEDDEDVHAQDGRKIEQLRRKHGTIEFDKRWHFLEEYKKSL